MDGNKLLDFEELMELLNLLRSRPSISGIFDRYSMGSPTMSDTQFLNFLLTEQKESEMTLDIARLIINHFAKDSRTLNRKTFEAFLTSNMNDVFNLEHSQVYQDMTQPLTHYYINSSHNTYLEGIECLYLIVR